MEQLDLLAWIEPEALKQRVTIICANIEDVDLSAHGPFDALFSDPPYGLKFMGQKWDKGVPGPAIWAHLATFLRPGANVAAFGGTRTYHRLACAVEDAGLEIRDSMWAWAYGSGWPKPANVAKYIDNHLIGIEWKKARIGRRGRGKGKRGPGGKPRPGGKRAAWYKKAQKKRYWIWSGQGVVGKNPNARASRAGGANQSTGSQTEGAPIVSLAHPEARAFEGYHGNLKPAVEPLVLARKPLDGTLAQNALAHGVVGLNIDGCRIEAQGRPLISNRSARPVAGTASSFDVGSGKAIGKTDLGRWPTNFVLTCPCADSTEHLPGCHVRALDEQSGPSRSSKGKPRAGGVGFATTHTGAEYDDQGGASRYFKVIPVCPCDESGHLPGCHVRELDEQTGILAGGGTNIKKTQKAPDHTYGKSLSDGQYRQYSANTGGTGSRFFYCAKVSRKERAGLKHPTMKPLKLTEYYARLLLPPPIRERVLMVPCSGVCSELLGAVLAGWERVVGIEKDPEYARQGANRVERITGIEVERIGFE